MPSIVVLLWSRLFVARDERGLTTAELLGNAALGQLSREDRIPIALERDHADVGGVALVAGPCMRDVNEADLHAITSTAVCTSVLSMSAGQ